MAKRSKRMARYRQGQDNHDAFDFANALREMEKIVSMLRQFGIDEDLWMEAVMKSGGMDKHTPPSQWRRPPDIERFLPWNMTPALLAELRKSSRNSHNGDGHEHKHEQKSDRKNEHKHEHKSNHKSDRQDARNNGMNDTTGNASKFASGEKQNSACSAAVVEKIRKLLTLADGNQNEHEREVAMQAAMDLLSKHNLTMASLQAETADGIEVGEVVGNFKLDPWIRGILSACSKLYYTEFFLRHYHVCGKAKPERKAVFVGTAENVAVTIDVANWLISSIKQESNRLYKDEFERRSFRLGAAHRVYHRVQEMMTAEQKTSKSAETGTSLVVVRNRLQEANAKHMSKLNFRKKGTARRLYFDRDAYADGESYGDELQLSRQGQSATNELPQLLSRA